MVIFSGAKIICVIRTTYSHLDKQSQPYHPLALALSSPTHLLVSRHALCELTLNAAAAPLQRVDVPVHTALASHLIAHQVPEKQSKPQLLIEDKHSWKYHK